MKSASSKLTTPSLLIGGIAVLVIGATLLIRAQGQKSDDQSRDVMLAYLLCEDFDCTKASRALKQVGSELGRNFIRILKEGLPKDVDPRPITFARVRAAYALGDLRFQQAVPDLVRVLSDPSPELRAACAEALGKIGDKVALNPLQKAEQIETDAHVRETMRASIRTLQR